MSRHDREHPQASLPKITRPQTGNTLIRRRLLERHLEHDGDWQTAVECYRRALEMEPVAESAVPPPHQRP